MSEIDRWTEYCPACDKIGTFQYELAGEEHYACENFKCRVNTFFTVSEESDDADRR